MWVTQNKNQPVSEVTCNKTVLGMKWEAAREGRLMPASQRFTKRDHCQGENTKLVSYKN